MTPGVPPFGGSTRELEHTAGDPRAFAFRLPMPNPARTGAVFAVELPRAARLTLAIFSVDGRRVRTLMDTRQDAGFHRIAWDRTTDAGARVAAGVYLARAEA